MASYYYPYGYGGPHIQWNVHYSGDVDAAGWTQGVRQGPPHWQTREPAQTIGGYDCEFVEPPPDELICLICTFAARQPHQLDCCGRVFCKTCLDRYKYNRNPCPNCRGRGKAFIDRRGERNILSLKVKCNGTASGCDWQGELRSLDSHLSTCSFALVPCPNRCTQDGNELEIPRKYLESHLQECPNRPYKCLHCGAKGKYVNLTTTHLERCPEMEVLCPNGCGERVKRCKLQSHCRFPCQNQKVRCSYAELGCGFTCSRRDMKQHETNEKDLHLSLAMTTVGQLKQQQATVNSAPRLVFKMPRFSSTTQWYSPPFYSHRGGYKMCMSADADGFADGEGTHVSVWFHFMQGENDNYLTWPFQGSVEVQLLNQIQDLHHHTRFLGSNSRGEVEWNRRAIQGRGDIRPGAGWSQFIHHNSLHRVPSRGCQYLVRDCLYFRILGVEVYGHVKPWLT